MSKDVTKIAQELINQLAEKSSASLEEHKTLTGAIEGIKLFHAKLTEEPKKQETEKPKKSKQA